MTTLVWRCAGLGIFATVLLLGSSERSAEARLVQECGIVGSLPRMPTPRPRYDLRVRVQPGLRTVTGALTVTFALPSGQRTDRIILRLWPNGPRYATSGAKLKVSRVREAGHALRVSYPNPTTLVVDRPVAGGGRAVVSMNWRLALPRENGLRMKGGGRSMRLGSFFPLLAWNGTDWELDPPTRLRAEAWTSPAADSTCV